MAKRVTLQDIADSLNLSRNTVSKAINNSPVVADATKQLIFEKAKEMGYKQFSYFGMPQADPGTSAPNIGFKKEIALFTETIFDNSHFASYMIDRIQSELRRLNYGLTIYRLMEEDIKEKHLPPSFDQDRVAGLIVIELFDYEYMEMLCDLPVPTLTVDAPIDADRPPLRTDILLMENQTGIHRLIHHLASRGITKIGFVGDISHCQSFLERFTAYNVGLYLNNLPYNDRFTHTRYKDPKFDPDYEAYLESIKNWIQNLNELPECIICANDFVAKDVINTLRELGRDVPKDVLIAGFDDSQESKQLSPKLTTVHIHSQSMGVTAVEMLFSRIQDPGIAFRRTYVESELILRESTGS